MMMMIVGDDVGGGCSGAQSMMNEAKDGRCRM